MKCGGYWLGVVDPRQGISIVPILERYQTWLDAEELQQLAAALERPLPPAIRVNTLKTTIDYARRTWPEWYGWEIDPVPFCKDGWQIFQHQQPPSQTLEYKMGHYYIQDAASMLPGELFTDADTPLILDMAAAPGGKTTHLVTRYADRALIVANDVSHKRITALQSNLQVWGAMGVMVTNYHAEQLGNWFPETFDKVLLDAPCSGDTLRAEKGRKHRAVSDKEQQQLCQRQIALLVSGFQTLKVGGELVYATCTLAPEENEGVLSELLRRYPHQARIEAIDHLPVARSGLIDTAYHPDTARAIRLWPHHFQTSGFFAARLRKIDVVPIMTNDSVPMVDSLMVLDSRRERQIVDELLQVYGFDLRAVIAQHDLVLYERGQYVYAAPQALLTHFDMLPHRSAGLMIGQLETKGFMPSHELITRFEHQFVTGWLDLSDEQCRIWLAGRDLRHITTTLPTRTIALLRDEQGRFVGRGKVLPDRIRNLLPKRIV